MNRNSEVLADFVKYCQEHPDERFWQAIRNWSGYFKVVVGPTTMDEGLDTFYWEGKRHES
jgi:hypothetical protein